LDDSEEAEDPIVATMPELEAPEESSSRKVTPLPLAAVLRARGFDEFDGGGRDVTNSIKFGPISGV
jgi:hypothetical protein